MNDWRMTVTRRPGPLRQRLSECGELSQWIGEDGKYVFVIGPGCARLGTDRPDIVAPVAEAMMRCFRALDDPADRQFLALLAWRVGIDLTLAEDPADDEVDDALLGFRKELVRIARLSVAAISDAMAGLDEPILDWERHAVPLFVARDASEIVEGLGTLGTLLTNLGQLIERRTAPLDESLTRKAPLDQNAQTELAWSDLVTVFGLMGVKSSIETLKQNLEAGKHLSGAYVEWLTSLLWHSFRFGAPWYPSTDELAFQLSVVWEGAPVTEVPDRALATQRHSDQGDAHAPLSRLLQLAGRYNNKQGYGERRALYRSIARLLIERNPLAGTDEAAFAGITGPLLPRVALTSCFDPLLEEAVESQLRAELADADWAYHVIVPALTISDLMWGRGTAHINWLLGTNQRGAWSWSVLPNPAAKTPFLGPIIVRLNGDPLHTWPDAAAITGSTTRYRSVTPMIVVSEFQHLSVGLNEVQIYDVVKTNGSEKGRFIVLGEFLDEWSMRQRLFGQAMYLMQKPLSDDGGDGATTNFVEAISINRRVDDVRRSLLRWVNIKEYEGDLSEVVGKLRTLADQRKVAP